MWQQNFEHLLRIRFKSHHAKCSSCVKHRLLIKKLGHSPAACRAQRLKLQAHLERQHKDRMVYYEARARSRLGSVTLGLIQVTSILDSMDAAKHAWPRSRSMQSKEFASFVRPRLTSTSLIVHGYMVLLALSPSLVTTGSARTAEILAAGLTKLATKLDMRCVFLELQADNSAKEVKNIGMLRVVALWICLHKLGAAQISFLTSGHSHEDIDAMFSVIRSHLERCHELPTPVAFRDSLRSFFQNPEHRPHEPQRWVELMSRYKDWKLI